MSGCVLHFGMHKTGSTSIQDSLYRGLADPRFHYIDLGRPNASAALTMAFSATPEKQNMNRKRGRSAAEVAGDVAASRRRLHEQLAVAPEATRILSAEHMVTLRPEELAAMIAFLGEHGAEPRAAGYVRSPASYMESVFQQRVKGGRGELDPERMFPQYRKRLGKLEQVLGRARIEYWPFRRESFPAGCVVQDFCSRLGIRFDPAAVQRSNEALSLPALRLLFAYRKFGPGYGTGDLAVRENMALIAALRTLEGPRLRFHAALVAPVLERHRDDIDWMEQRLGSSLAEPLHEEAGALQGEQDLVRFERPELEWLAERTPMPLPARAADADPREIARALHGLRGTLLAPARDHPGRSLLGRLRRMLSARSDAS